MLETQEEILAIQTVELESEGLGVLYLKSGTAFYKRPSFLCQSSCVFILFLGDTLLEEMDPEVLSMGQWKLPVDIIC